MPEYPRTDADQDPILDADEDPDVPELSDEDARAVTSEPIEMDDGRTVRIAQQPVGSERTIGGGEFPDPDTPPVDAAPGGDQTTTPPEEF